MRRDPRCQARGCCRLWCEAKPSFRVLAPLLVALWVPRCHERDKFTNPGHPCTLAGMKQRAIGVVVPLLILSTALATFKVLRAQQVHVVANAQPSTPAPSGVRGSYSPLTKGQVAQKLQVGGAKSTTVSTSTHFDARHPFLSGQNYIQTNSAEDVDPYSNFIFLSTRQPLNRLTVWHSIDGTTPFLVDFLAQPAGGPATVQTTAPGGTVQSWEVASVTHVCVVVFPSRTGLYTAEIKATKGAVSLIGIDISDVSQ